MYIYIYIYTYVRSAEGISDESLDEPLHHDVQKSLEKGFTKYYKFSLKAINMGGDGRLCNV